MLRLIYQKSIIRIVYLLQVSGSDLLFISAIINRKAFNKLQTALLLLYR